ncbi:hypothetical protein PBI_SCTP2_48 [Salicola phage SCTP-2]|nr:hypothetical protein PBI_SCTP2_48 [Salicola phage SCTP-2]
MKVKHITQYLFESYKDAQAKFAQEASDEEVKQYLDIFKQLAKKGTVSGQEKDIGYWIKQGWNSFKEFVDSKSQEKSKSQVKKGKKSDSIIAHEDDEKMIVIPLTKDASCYYGKNTKWCTSGYEDNKFNQYFYQFQTVLFYVLSKISDEKIAIKYPTFDSTEEIEYVNEYDEELEDEQLEIIKDKFNIDENMLDRLYLKYEDFLYHAMDLDNTPEDIQIEILKDEPDRIDSIDNPTEKVKELYK